MHVIFLSTSVGPIGSGIGGGVELTLRTLADGLVARGHRVTVVAPRGSQLGTHEVMEVDGELHVPSQTLDRSTAPITPTDSVLTNMWKRIVEIAQPGVHDVVLNFAYDSAPFMRASECAVPIAHLVSMGSLSDDMDRAVKHAISDHPMAIAMHSRAQADTFGADVANHVIVVESGIDITKYEFVANPTTDIALVARISPEKGVNDAFSVAELSGRRLRVFGVMEDSNLWSTAKTLHPRAEVVHEGFLATSDLQSRLGRCAALIMVHHWVEAFGNVAIEALACGVPVITYDRGGPPEIVRDGTTGFVVPVDQPTAVADALTRIGAIDRRACRADAERRFSAGAFAGRVEHWLAARIGRGVESPVQPG
jgi:UDP-glucose:tetrahydrobiopterin glucosyltransferase